MQTMYDGVNGSPSNKLLNLINSSATSITLDSASNLPAAPNIATIGDSATAEVILYTGKIGSTLTGVTRGFGGTTAQSWAANTPVYRAFTKYDYDAIKLNINTIGDAASTNLLINGGFDVWQRGTSQTVTGYGSDDRWWNYSATSTKTHSRQAFTVGQTDVPGNPTYYSRTEVTSGGTASSRCMKFQKIENVMDFSGKTISYSFYAKADAVRNISIEISQEFGAGGSAAVNSLGMSKVAIGTSWSLVSGTVTLPSVAGKTIADGNSLTFLVWFDAGSDYNARSGSLGNQSGTFDIANVQLNYGSVALPFVPRSYADELRLCQRYAYPLSLFRHVRMTSYTVNYIDFDFPISSIMRVAPTASVAAFTVVSMANVNQTGFTNAVVAFTSGGLRIRASKNSHGLTDAFMEVTTAGVFDAEL